MENRTARWRGGSQADRPVGGQQAPLNIKAEVPPHLHLQQTTSIEGKRRDVGEGESCNSEALTDFASEPQVTNISQLCHSKFFVFLIL